MKVKTKADYIKKMERRSELSAEVECKLQKSKHKKIYKSRNIAIPAIPEHSTIRPKAKYKNQESRLRNRRENR